MLVFRILTFVVYSVRKICARRPFVGQEHCTPFSILATLMHLILLAYSQTNSCIWLTKEAILGQAASPLQQKILRLKPYFTSILLKQFLPASQV